MTALDYAAWGVFIITVVAGVWIALVLGALPGKIAQRRNHPCAEGVKVAGWVGLFMGGVFWPIALIWAYVDVPRSNAREAAK